MPIVYGALLSAVTATGPGAPVPIESTTYRVHTAIVTANGTSPIADVAIEITHDGANWAPAGTLTFNGVGSKSLTFEACALQVRANVTQLSGNPDHTVTATISSG